MTGGSERRARLALVLGSGGIVGGAYHAGVLKALNDTWGIDARSADLIVGTSAGSIAGALTASGLHPNDLFRRETGSPLSPNGRALLARGRQNRGARPVTRSTVGGPPAAPGILWHAARHPRKVAWGSLAAALMPRGAAPTDQVAGMIEGLFDDTWPVSPRLRICAVELHSGQRVVFGPPDDHPEDPEHPGDLDDLEGRARPVRATPAEAIAASCAVPSVFAPVAIDDREYLDGGVHSADNLDLVGRRPFDLVVVSSPMSSQRPLSGELPLMGLRGISRHQTQRERKTLDPGCRVEILRPTPEDLDAMGSNMLDPRRRPATAFQAHASACAFLSERERPAFVD